MNNVLPSSAQVDAHFERSNKKPELGVADYKCPTCGKLYQQQKRKNLQSLKVHLSKHNIIIPEGN
jgi:transposase-like protein